MTKKQIKDEINSLIAIFEMALIDEDFKIDSLSQAIKFIEAAKEDMEAIVEDI